MKTNKLIRILRLLTISEIKDFRAFVASPYFNKNKKCIELLDLLIPYSPSFSDEELDQSNFADSIYTKKRSLETLKSVLLRLLEQFLIHEKFKHNYEIQTYFLLEELRERREDQHYDLTYKKSKKITTQKNRNNSIYYGEFLIELSQLEMSYQKMTSRKTNAEQLNKVIIAFDKYCLSNHLWLDNVVLNLRDFGGEEMNKITNKLVEQSQVFIDFAKLSPYKNEALIKMRLSLNHLLKNGTEDNFNLLLNNLKNNHTSISYEDKVHFNKFIANYCIRRIIKGDNSYYKKLLEFYMLAIDIGTLIEGKYLHPKRLSNIITTSVKANEIELAHELLKKYNKYIAPEHQDTTRTYCTGYLYYQEMDYPNALDHLNECIKQKSAFGMAAQAITYKIYYEINESWAFRAPIKSFMTKLLRHSKKQPEYILDGYRNFFKILKQIYKKKHDPNYSKSKKELILSIEKKEHLSDKEWLLKKIQELG